MHGDGNLLNQHPDLQEALVWVYFHSNLPEFNKVECWGPLKDAGVVPADAGARREEEDRQEAPSSNDWDLPEPCRQVCHCCFPPTIDGIARGGGVHQQRTWTEVVEP